jgi:hypothetical protein
VNVKAEMVLRGAVGAVGAPDPASAGLAVAASVITLLEATEMLQNGFLKIKVGKSEAYADPSWH